MPEPNADANKEYRYNEMSNKVIRSTHKRSNDDGVNYNPTSMAGQVTSMDMGSAVTSSTATEGETNQRKAERDTSSAAPKNVTPTVNYASYQSSTETISYNPSNPETAHIFDLMLTWVHNYLTDATHDVILSATDTILEMLKSSESSQSLGEVRKEVAQLIDTKIGDEEFNELVNLAKRITDYQVSEVDGDEVDENDNALAVEFGDEDGSESEGGSLGGVAHDLDDDDDDADSDNQAENSENEQENDPMSNEAVIQTSDPNDSTSSSDIIPLHLIDEFYLQRQVSALLKSDPESVQQATNSLHTILSNQSISSRQLENELMELFEFDHFDFIRKCIENRWRIVYKTKWDQIDKSDGETDREQIASELESLKLNDLLTELENLAQETSSVGVDNNRKRKRSDDDAPEQIAASKRIAQRKREPKVVDLDSLAFDQGSRLMTTTKIKLPPGSFQQKKKLYDIITIPPPDKPPSLEESNEKLVDISSLPEWCQGVFPSSETSSLNRIQSKVFPSAFGNDDNLLLCAPTGAGKTNVAMLTVLKTIENYRNKETGTIDLKKFKIVYIAPLKALVQEQMREFQRRLTPTLGIAVNELTGDSSLSKQQIRDTQIIVTTPEKWDVITRKATSELEITSLTKLIIVDEIHLLHDERGPVLESIISRTLRASELSTSQSPVRLVGLSATLPNYKDVAKFLRVDESKNLYYFDASYRPCPLEQQFIGIKEKKAIKKINAMNEACYDKVVECARKKDQLIIFVHSRKDTFKTAKWISDKLIEEGKSELILEAEGGAISEILKQEASNMKNNNLKEIIPRGFGIHHAGLDKQERSTVEDLFAQGHIQVLVSTATLAWGVNLPAHTVVIKGTETYSPEKGSWVQLSPQDILQMLGRAGRPRYDKSGEGVIITSQEDIQYYLAILNQQLPIESQLMTKLADSINAEIVLGTIKSIDDAVNWLGYTYLYIRMLQSPSIYKVGPDYKDDKALNWKRVDLSHSALTLLSKNKLIVYDSNGDVKPTDLGKIASHFYINYPTINMFNSQLKPWHTEIDIFKVFANAGEFKYIAIRQEERMELVKLMERSPIPIKESSNDPLAKVNVLLQAYISKLTLEGFALMADMIYITQSAGRLLRAIHEIALKKGWSSLSKLTLNLCKMVEKRMWLSSSPFRQFDPTEVPKEVIRATENSSLPWLSYFTLSPSELAEAVNLKGNSNKAYSLIQQFPKLSFSYTVQPITPTLLRIHLEVLPEWEWNSKLSHNSESFLLLIEDCDGDKILYSDQFQVYRQYINEVHYVDFSIPLLEPLQPVYFVTLISEKWLHSEWRVPLILEDLKIPKKFPAFTELLDLQSVPLAELNQPEFEEVYENFTDLTYFNKFQSQAFKQIYNSDENLFIGISKGSGKTLCGELAILRNWKQNKGRVVYINPTQEVVDQKLKAWKRMFGGSLERVVNKLSGGSHDLSTDISILNSSHLTLATPEQFDLISRRWRQRKAIQSIDLLIFDDIHMVGTSGSGSVYESIISRMRFMDSQLEEKTIRMIGLSSPLANGRDFAEWFGCTKSNVLNFSPNQRFNKINEIRLQATSAGNNVDSLLIKSTFSYLKNNLKGEENDLKSLVFLPTRKHCIDVGLELVSLSGDWDLLRVEEDSITPYLNKLSDVTLRESIKNGIGFMYKGMNPTDRLITEKLYDSGALTILLATKDTCYFAPVADFVIILSTRQYDGREHRYIDYSINDILEMIGCSGDNAKALILTNANMLAYYQKFLNEGLPVESFMDSYLHEIFTTDISTRTFKTRQDCIDWLTFTFFYRRLQQNPSFYGLKDTSHLGVSEYLSDLVEDTLKELEDAKIVEIEDEDENEEDEDDEEEEEEEEELLPLDGAIISGYYNISYLTMKDFRKLTNKSRMKDILEIITNASEFESLPIRENEQNLLGKIYARIPVKTSNVNYESPYFKAFILLQAHFSRFKLPSIDLILDQKFVLERILNLLYGCIDTLSSEGYLNAINAMDLSQMIVQGVWDRDSPLKQIPYFDNKDILERCATAKVETVYDIMSLEDEERDEVLQMTGEKLEKVAEFVNQYPNIDISYEINLEDPIVHDEPNEIVVTLQRDEDMDDLTVVSTAYPFKKKESWWIVVGDNHTKQLYAIKKTNIAKEIQSLKLEFTVPNVGHHTLSIWCMCDSYVDADKEVTFEIDVI